ncbi:MAG TPA: hypothetical protein PKM60_11755 [Zoogloea sp.]|jgi:hypothetical protein|uniref:hypothetical protein n=1 Tax=Zoogloea sp. TaxID=49181 RepID=UPI001B4BB2EB|nr:hypothetical protein [Zoogloea sp.]MBP8265696.1 hypothetical protein [Zoogloea sp.]HOB46843.1 hypothetical protein [Zoogloea sp.]HQA09379.1 hypothetical protein [Zoogloea sp.]HQE39930.1 hypothetical protein [Zoogloea sp.]
MHLTFDWNMALRRSRPRPNPPSGEPGTVRRAWKRFPYGDRVYRYGGCALASNWCRLHRGDRELFPSAANIAELLRANPALASHVTSPADAAIQLEAAWRAYHAGDFADAADRGLAAGPVGVVVAARAATVYAAHLEEDEARRLSILREAVEASAEVLDIAPNWANAWYVHGTALRCYSQNISVVKALAQGMGGKVRDCLQRALELEPGHADAHVGLGVYCAEVIDKVGAMVGALSYGVRKEAVVDHFETAIELHAQSPVVLAEYARAIQLVDGGAGAGRAYEIYAAAAACQPADALERLGVERARSEIG